MPHSSFRISLLVRLPVCASVFVGFDTRPLLLLVDSCWCPRTHARYLLKFTRSGKGNVVVIIESGVRMHTTKYEREKDTMPASFAAQCRKYLRNKRLVSVRQVGTQALAGWLAGSLARSLAHWLACSTL